jgi:two-component system nitrate/nitrite response regulator NarL
MPSSRSDRMRILIADDNKYIRDKVVQLLDVDFDVVGTASDGIGAVEAAKLLSPEIIVMDISMPGLSGIDAMAQIKGTQDHIKVVFLTVHDDLDFVRASLDAGGCGYVVKSRLATDLLAAIRRASEDQIFISPCVAISGESTDMM